MRDFLLTRYVWFILGAAVVFFMVVAVMVVFPLFRTAKPVESHEGAARESCQAEVTARLDTAADGVRFVGEIAEEFGENTWNVSGTAELGWSERRAYACTYTGAKIVDVRVDPVR